MIYYQDQQSRPVTQKLIWGIIISLFSALWIYTLFSQKAIWVSALGAIGLLFFIYLLLKRLSPLSVKVDTNGIAYKWDYIYPQWKLYKWEEIKNYQLKTEGSHSGYQFGNEQHLISWSSDLIEMELKSGRRIVLGLKDIESLRESIMDLQDAP